MKGKARRLLLFAVGLSLAAGAWATLWRRRPNLDDALAVPRLPRISPDYSQIVIPPNIAPLNFAVREPGDRYFVRVRSETGGAIEIAGSARITIPLERWQAVLSANRGKKLMLDVYTQTDGGWRRYQTIVNRIAEEPIDGYLAYRLTGPIHYKWYQVEVRQRDLASYRESAVLDGMSFGGGCVNCHSFANNDPNRMLISTRSRRFGNAALLVDHGAVKKIAAQFGYTAWHPSGRIAAYSINKVRQFFHASGAEVRDVVDLDSALAYYLVEAATTKMVPGASDKQSLETYPAWSPDGRYLYYCAAPFLRTDRDQVPPERYSDVKYDLLRIGYDVEADQWGEPETVLSARETGLSILQPRISPDGKFLLFCMCRYGCFPVFQASSDLYMMDLATGDYARLDVNSRYSESWHSWSSNSRWIAFSSRRQGGFFTRCYLSFVDRTGKAHKPFVVPQSDPEFYDSLLKSISVPELITGPVPVPAETIARTARSDVTIAVDAITRPSPLAVAPEPRQPAGR
jgi:hypothetical protein